ATMLQETTQSSVGDAWGPSAGFDSEDEPMLRQIADFIADARYETISKQTKAALDRAVLDTLASAIAALGSEPARRLRDQFNEYGGRPICTLIGGGKTSPHQAALLNSMLVRYVDVLDTYMSPGGLCHPSDNFGSILAAAEMADRSGKEFLLGL